MEEGTLVLVATDHITNGGFGSAVDDSCSIPCGMRLVSTVESCRWRLALATRVGRLAAEIATEKCSRVRNNASNNEVVLRFKLQRFAPMAIDVSGNSVDLVITPDYMSDDRLDVGARASAAYVAEAACSRLLNGFIDRGSIMAVNIANNLPAIGLKSLWNVLGEPVLYFTIDRDAIVIIKNYQLT